MELRRARASCSWYLYVICAYVYTFVCLLCVCCLCVYSIICLWHIVMYWLIVGWVDGWVVAWIGIGIGRVSTGTHLHTHPHAPLYTPITYGILAMSTTLCDIMLPLPSSPLTSSSLPRMRPTFFSDVRCRVMRVAWGTYKWNRSGKYTVVICGKYTFIYGEIWFIGSVNLW